MVGRGGWGSRVIKRIPMSARERESELERELELERYRCSKPGLAARPGACNSRYPPLLALCLRALTGQRVRKKEREIIRNKKW